MASRFTQTRFSNTHRRQDDGSFRLIMDYFDYCTGLTHDQRAFDALFGGPPRSPRRRSRSGHGSRRVDPGRDRRSRSAPARSPADETGCENLCLAGGVALNCVANGKCCATARSSIWIQPAAGDAGGALGAALAVHHICIWTQPRDVNGMRRHAGRFSRPGVRADEIERRLTAVGRELRRRHGRRSMIERLRRAARRRQSVGWFQGRMEFGPRALGGRSILGDARSPTMQSTLNLKIKYRESFRPFAPAVLREDVERLVRARHDSPYMLLVADVAESAPPRDDRRAKRRCSASTSSTCRARTSPR